MLLWDVIFLQSLSFAPIGHTVPKNPLEQFLPCHILERALKFFSSGREEPFKVPDITIVLGLFSNVVLVIVCTVKNTWTHIHKTVCWFGFSRWTGRTSTGPTILNILMIIIYYFHHYFQILLSKNISSVHDPAIPPSPPADHSE